jgi:hypothetical protein
MAGGMARWSDLILFLDSIFQAKVSDLSRQEKCLKGKKYLRQVTHFIPGR